jgi:DNA mismatch repair protein MutL
MTTAEAPGIPRIHALSERLANQIAAGEVVERPASVLKELLENSLDAGAERVQVDIEHGGVRLIRVRDDGVGIHRQDLALALGRHATSKIASLGDLENVASLGFRGEALPSIASVSRLELCSCPAGEESGWRLAAEGCAATLSPEPAAHPRGTTVSVRDLFYNTPARRKFLRTEKTEYRHLEDVLKRAALSRFDCAFTLHHNGRETYALAAAANEAERARRVARLCGNAFMEQSLALSFAASDLRLYGWIGAPGYSRGVADLQYFFVNGRMVRDQLLRHAVRQAHHGLVESGRHPAYVLFLHISPAQVDVNVHPSKHEVRFRDARSVHDFIVRGVRQASAENANGLESSSVATTALSGDAHGHELGHGPAHGPATYATVREHAPAYAGLRSAAGEGSRSGSGLLGEAVQQVDHRYVVARNVGGLVVVDARRACGLVARAGLDKAVAAGPMDARPLLVPVAVAVEERQADLLESRLPFLERLGFDLRRVAPESVSCRGIPAPLAAASPRELVLAIASSLAADVGDGDASAGETAALFDAVLARCDLTAAWSWDHDSMNDLLRQLERLQDASRTRDGDTVWRQLDADDIAALLRGGR